MPKPNMHPDNYVESSGALAGKFEVVGSVFKIHQANQREGQTETVGPVCAHVLKIHPITDDGEKVEDAAEMDLVLGLGKKSIASFHPGKADNAEDAEPEDLGDEVGTEGNTIYSTDGMLPNAATTYAVFMKSLAHKGFAAKSIADCYAPNFMGLKFELATVTPDKLEAYGGKKRPAENGSKITYKVVQSIIEHPKAASTKKEKAAKPTKAAAAALSSVATSTSTASADEGSGGGGDEAEDIARSVLGDVSVKLAGQTKKLNGVKTFWLANYGKNDPKLQKTAREFVNNATWLKDNLEAMDAAVAGDDVTFPEAA